MADAYTIPRAELVARLRDYEGEAWETTACYNGLREAAAARIEELETALDAALKTAENMQDRLVLPEKLSKAFGVDSPT